jgi:hypothetical protein
MSLPEFVTPVLSIAGPAALLYVIMRYFPLVARAVVVLLAGIAAIVTTDSTRRTACLKVLDALGRPDDILPEEKAGTLPSGVRRARRREGSGHEGTIP